MQIQRHNIRCGKGCLRELRQKQFVDQLISFDPNPLLL